MLWEIIESNKRKSFFIFIAMGFCLLLLGWVVGEGSGSGGGLPGVFVSAMIWLFLSLISYFSGDSILLATSRAKEVSHDIHPQLFNVVEEMKIAGNLPAMPRVYIIDDPAPNAFATGRNPEKSAIAVTAGLLSMCSRDELQGVIAHEMSHILNRDILYVTFAGVLLGSITLLSEGFLRIFQYSGSSRRYRSNDDNKGAAVLLIIAVVFAILAPIFARLLYFALSRKREYLADACAVRLTRYPEGLASALEKISGSHERLQSANSVTAPLYIANPFGREKMEFFNFSTHPPIQDRIAVLRKISGGSSFADYDKAYANIHGQAAAFIPVSGMKSGGEAGIRKPAPDQARGGGTKKEMVNLMRAVNQFAFLNCSCGLKITLPPNYSRPEVTCPKCQNKLAVPKAPAMKTPKAPSPPEASLTDPPQIYRKIGDDWQTIECEACGRGIQLSPGFGGAQIFCPDCGNRISIVKGS